MAVLKDCPTLRYYTFTDAQKILVGFLSQIKDRNSADYKKYFDELMDVYDLRMKYIPEFIGKGMKGVPSVADAWVPKLWIIFSSLLLRTLIRLIIG